MKRASAPAPTKAAPDSEERTAVLVPMKGDQKAILRAAAKAAGMPLATWMRSLAIREAHLILHP